MYLMLQNNPIMYFDISERKFEVFEADKLPIKLRGLFPNNGIYQPMNIEEFKKYDKYYSAMLDFLSHRVLNMNRKNAKKILNNFNLSQSQDPITKVKIAVACKAVSMTDDYWLNDDKKSLSWENINPRKNHLNEIVAHIALTGSSLTATGLLHTPELTGHGIYAKAWIRENDDMYLYKASTKGNIEHKIEAMVSDLLDCFDIEHVKYLETKYYDFETQNYMEVCKCKNMSTDEKCIVSAEDFYSYCSRVDKDFYNEVIDIDSENFYKTLIVDYLISNSDRHMENWGFYMDNLTGNFISLHPMFDHNNAFDERDMEDNNGGKSLMLPNKTKKEAALYASKRCHIRCIKPITKNMFLTDKQYYSFMNRACELGLYKHNNRSLLDKIKKTEEYSPIKIEKPIMYIANGKKYPANPNKENSLFEKEINKESNFETELENNQIIEK